MTLIATVAEFSCLLRKEFLSKAVLDSIMQSTVLPQDDASEETIPPPAMIGSLGYEAWISTSNFTATLQSQWNHQRQHLVTKLCTKLARILDVNASPDLPQRLIIPMVSPPDLIGPFFVACFDFSAVHHSNSFVEISFHDSLKRAKQRIHESSTAAAIVKKVNLFFNKFILHERKYQS